MRCKEIEQLLPAVYRRTVGEGSLLTALLQAMETLHAPVETTLATLDATLDARRTRDPFVPFLARWVDLDWLVAPPGDEWSRDALALRGAFAVGTGRLRELVAAAAYLSKWRGTSRGLLSFLEIATGLGGFAVDERVTGADGRPRPFHIRLRVPRAARGLRPLITRIVEFEKPAHITYELAFEEEGVPAERPAVVPEADPRPAAPPPATPRPAAPAAPRAPGRRERRN